MIDTTIDGHMHTDLCNHAVGGLEDYVLAAIDQGLAGIIFLEHLELGINYFEDTWLSEADFAVYRSEGMRLREKYRDRISIGLGVEVGYNSARVDEIIAFLARYEWDRIGLSCHFMSDGNRHLNLVSRRRENWQALGELGIDQVVAFYFRQLREAVERLPGTVVCHLDAVLRHHPEVRISTENRRLALEVLDAMAVKGLSLEVNTSGFVHRGAPYPDRFFLKEAQQRGIPLVAGSDAHRPGDVGRYFERLGEWP